MIHSLDPTSIVVDSRFRDAEEKPVDELAISLLRFGQLQPIVITRDNHLVAGLHRLRACMLNQSNVLAIYTDEVDQLVLKEMELEENIRRKQMTWLEQEQAIAELHRIRQERDPSWGQRQTRELAGLPRQADVSEALQLTEMVKLFPELADAKSKNQALSWAKAKAKSILRVDEVKNNVVDFGAIEAKIALGNSIEFIKTLPDGLVHAIITDPPFGIDYDDRKSGSEGSLTAYEDDRDSYRRILSMAPDLYRIIKKDGWLVWFLGISWYEECKQVFRAAGFGVDEIPIIWDRSEGRAFTTRPDRYFGRAYDIALHCFKGDPQINVDARSKPNIIKVPPVTTAERETLVERPVELYAELIKRLTVPGELVADFFVGSGSCPAAAASLRRDYIGCELDPERRAWAIKKIKAHTPDEVKIA